MSFEQGSYVWIPDQQDVVIPAKVESSFSPGSAGKVFRLDNERSVKLGANETKDLLVMNEQALQGLDDMVGFKVLDEYTILHNLRVRFFNDIIYTNIGKILTSVNPFKMLPIYSPAEMDRYMEFGSRNMPPHVYGVADDAFNAMIENKASQSCIVSGESGAGKTEATKVFLQYISEKSKRSSAGKAGEGNVSGHEMQQKILESNPLMEAFGNAKTVRNDNSSRFGKWIEIQFDRNSGGIVGGSIKSYLLEKSRIVNQANEERNYHVFYQLCAASEVDPNLEKYNIDNATQYHYLNQSEEPCTVVASINDGDEWSATLNAMEKIGISEAEKANVINLLTAILSLGNVVFTGNEVSSVENKDVLTEVAKRLGTSNEDLEKAMVKTDRSTPRDPDLVGDNDLAQAIDARDAFAKHLYAQMFDWIIGKINIALGRVAANEKISTIGVLDIFGFEFFQNNSFEQLCINYCNERLQSHFNDHIFKLEQEQYRKEGIDVTKIEFVDNTNVLLTIDSKDGVLQLIAEQLKLTTATDETLLKKLRAKADELKKDALRADVLTYPDNKEAKAEPDLDNVFRINHYAGRVGYRIEAFLEKNRDAVPKLVQKLGAKSSNKFIVELFSSAADPSKKPLGLRFASQLKDLMDDLNATQPHYVRCVKPNAEKQGEIFTARMVLDQLKYAGLLEVCKIRQMGYPVRRDHSDFYLRYRQLVKTPVKNHNELIAALKTEKLISDSQYQVGNTKVFLKNNQAEDLEDARAKSLSLIVTKMQRIVRGFLVRRVSRKYKDIRKRLRDAIAKRDKNALTTALLGFGELPYGGKHLAEYREAMDLKSRIEDEERIAKHLIEAMKTRDLSQIETAIKAAEEKDLGKSPEAEKARKLVEQIKKEDACKATLREAIVKKDEAALKNAVAAAQAAKIGDCIECKDAMSLLIQIEKERVARMHLQEAIKAKDVSKIKMYMNQMADLGKGNDPLVHEGEGIVKEKAKEAAEIQARKESTLFGLNKAIRERNLLALETLEADIIDLGLEGEVVNKARLLRTELAREKGICARINAESSAAKAKAQTRAGLAAKDLDAFKAVLDEADEILQPDDFQLLSAKDELFRLETQLETQTTLSQALIDFSKLRTELAQEKDKAKKEAILAKILALLKDANNKIQESGIDTIVAEEIKDKLIQTQVEIDNRHKEERERERMENVARLKEANEEDMEQEEAKRLQFNAQFTDLLSEKHRNLIHEASNTDRYALNRFYRIRQDDDFVEKVPLEHKQAAAATKLTSRPKPISRSICRLEEEQNTVAIRINRAILQYCGDLATTFPATLAQYVLVRGLEDATMTDEIYIQLIKHINGNDKPDSADKAWLLMCMCTKIFPPSAEFAPYLLNFFITRKSTAGLIGNYARLCIVQLDATIELGPTWFKPNLEEIQSYRKRPPILATIYTLDNKQIDYPVTPEMRVAQVLDLIRKKEGVTDDYQHPTWGIYVAPEEEEEDESPKERLIRFYQFYNPGKLAHVDLFLDHWSGNAEELFQKLVEKYGPEPTEDDKTKKKGVLSLPITAAMNAVKYLGFANQRDQPPAPETSWPLPWWTHLGDVYYRMSKQKKVPKFVFKRRLITRQEPVDKWIYLQAVDDIRKGYLPITEPQKIAEFAALSLQYEHGIAKVHDSLNIPAIKDLGLAKYIPEENIKTTPLDLFASLVLNTFKAKGPKDQEEVMLKYVEMVRQIPIYGMNFFYARHAASEKNYVISVDVDGIHVLEPDRSAVKRSFGFHTIKKFGATADYFWMNIDERQETAKTKFKFLAPNQGINVLLYTLQSWEMYDCVYDATHIDVE